MSTSDDTEPGIREMKNVKQGIKVKKTETYKEQTKNKSIRNKVRN